MKTATLSLVFGLACLFVFGISTSLEARQHCRSRSHFSIGVGAVNTGCVVERRQVYPSTVIVQQPVRPVIVQQPVSQVIVQQPGYPAYYGETVYVQSPYYQEVVSYSSRPFFSNFFSFSWGR